jgi:hypothetical protein
MNESSALFPEIKSLMNDSHMGRLVDKVASQQGPDGQVSFFG